MRMNPRCHSSNSSRALIVLEKKPEAVGEKKLGFLGSDEEPFDTQQSATLHNTTQYQEHVTETRPPASALQDPRLPPQADASLATYEPAYPLTSYTGTAVGSKVGKGGMMRSKPTGDTSEDESTLIGSVMSRQENDSRRINALKSQGIVVNDVDMVSKAPEVLGFVPSKTEPAVPGPMLIGKTSKPNVWDYLDEQGDSEEDSSRDRAGCDARASKVSHDDTNILQHPSRESQAPATPVSPVEARAHDPPLVPFFHWDKNKTAEECRGSDVMVRQVLDEIHHRLFEHNDHWRIYKRGSDLTLEDLQTPSKGSLFSPPSDTVADPILNFRSTSSSRRKHELFDAIKFLVEMFIPPNFEHDTTKKIWGAMNKICQTLDGILNSTNEESFIIFQTQDYTNDKDLVEALRIPALKRPMKDCSRCQSRFMTLEEGLRHLNEEHFEHNVENGLEAETRGLYLRTTFQIEIEARVNAFLSLIEGCTKTFQEVGKTAKDMLDGTVKSADHVETKGYYPVVESLVRVFEHIVIILVFSADFMAKADKTMRTDRKRALDCGRFATKLRGSLNQIIRKAQKDLDQAKRDIILASNTDYDNDKLASIGPEFMVALVSNGLFFRRLDNASAKSSGEDSRAATSERDRTTIDASELYKRYANKLQLQVNQRPQKRLLPDIYAFEEEVEILQKVIDWQMKFCHDFYRVLDPNSYKITTKTRISHFNEERRYLHKTIDRLKVRSTEFTGLLVRSARLRDQLQQSIEIEEESHGNAIRVFTFVTLFFLPL
ncbi:hypothetical protein GGR57DRAFT_153163 [Xylariaceae sp. FL1272]|nr:hypothetical protein GGR57DRAFT_153163 [Xylariaceae sp. FL1272]